MRTSALFGEALGHSGQLSPGPGGSSAYVGWAGLVGPVRLFPHAPVITLRTYAHLFPGDEDRTRNVLDAALSPLADSSRTEAASIR